ncbi:MAG: MerR family transcriptional regulator [Armatimonadetes bacterium]|nr:MerR family transcriptional regulator [Armatimonadota bacterium]
MSGQTIGQVARQAGVGLETVRFYEREGLLAAPPRNAQGHRLFPAETVRRIRFIKRGQELGFTLSELRDLLDLRITGQASCGEVRQRALQKIEVIDRKLAALHRMREALAALVSECDEGSDIAACPILEALDEAP